MVQQIIASIIAAAFFFALGYICRDWIAKLYDRKPYNKDDIESVCAKWTDFEQLGFSTFILTAIDWDNIRPNEAEDWLKIIHEIHRKRLINKNKIS